MRDVIYIFKLMGPSSPATRFIFFLLFVFFFLPKIFMNLSGTSWSKYFAVELLGEVLMVGDRILALKAILLTGWYAISSYKFRKKKKFKYYYTELFYINHC